MAHTPLFRFLQRAVRTAHTARPRTIAPRASSLSRRRFLRYSTLAAGATVATSALAYGDRLRPVADTPAPRIAVVGGGIAGLSAAYHLQKLGLTATVYETKAQVGGRMQSRDDRVVPGLVNDLGGCFVNSDHEDLLSLIDELGLTVFDRSTAIKDDVPATAFYFEGRPIPEADLIAALGPIADQIGQDADLLEEDFDWYATIFDALSVADYLDLHSDKIPEGYVRALLETTIRTEYGVEPEASSALQLLFNLPTVADGVEPISSDEAFLVQGGSGLVPVALAAKLDSQVRTGWRLEGLRSTLTGYQLTFNRGTVEADYVVLALPCAALRQVDLQVELPTGLERFIREVNLGRNEKVFAGFSDRTWHQPTGFTTDAWADQGYSALWEDTQRQSEFRQGVLTFYLGGDEAHLSGDKATEKGPQFVDALKQHIPTLGSPVERFYRTYWGQDRDIGGGYTSFKPGQYTEFSGYLYIESDDPDERQDVAVGNLVFAGEQFSDEYYGFMNGGAQTGRLAAEVVASRVGAIAEVSRPLRRA
ncbi:FAD-dependent oxidoreductase [filamentous cyanobacterium CCT1]|nr:FAD-dependent oxidoreductase [filamentous cyanobacterium CCT1]PSN78158.1 FAD-dependent oxidoreductase [filamentous cyanobacterium CCP4]